MAWQVTRENVDKSETITAAQQFGTFEAAFRASMGQVMTFITGHWDASSGADVDGPADDAKFKMYIDRRDPVPHIRLTYMWVDSTQPVGQQGRGNEVIYTFIEV